MDDDETRAAFECVAATGIAFDEFTQHVREAQACICWAKDAATLAIEGVSGVFESLRIERMPLPPRTSRGARPKLTKPRRHGERRR